MVAPPTRRGFTSRRGEMFLIACSNISTGSLAGPLAHQVKRLINHSRGRTFLSLHHQTIDETCDEAIVVANIAWDLSFCWSGPSHFFTPSYAFSCIFSYRSACRYACRYAPQTSIGRRANGDRSTVHSNPIILVGVCRRISSGLACALLHPWYPSCHAQCDNGRQADPSPGHRVPEQQSAPEAYAPHQGCRQ